MFCLRRAKLRARERRAERRAASLSARDAMPAMAKDDFDAIHDSDRNANISSPESSVHTRGFPLERVCSVAILNAERETHTS